MKKSLWLLSLLGILVLSWCWSSLDVIEYNDSLVEYVKECLNASQSLYQTFNAEWATVDSIADSVQNNITICQAAKEKSKKLWDYEKDSSLKDGVVNLLSANVDYLEKFATTKPYRNANLSDEDRVAYDSVVSELNQSQTVLNQQLTNLQDIQEWFAARHGLKLQ